MKVAVLSPDELEALIMAAVDRALAKTRPLPESEIMTCDQVAELLHVHPFTIPKLIDDGLPELRRIGTHRRFRRSEVVKWMTDRKKTA